MKTPNEIVEYLSTFVSNDIKITYKIFKMRHSRATYQCLAFFMGNAYQGDRCITFTQDYKIINDWMKPINFRYTVQYCFDIKYELIEVRGNLRNNPGFHSLELDLTDNQKLEYQMLYFS